MKTSANLYKWIVVSLFAACTAIASHAQPSNNCTPAPSGLVSWWRAEGDGVDSISGNTAYAALLPSGVSFAPGEVGQAFQLNGTNAYLFVPTSSSLDVGAGAGLTMEGWIKVSSVSGLHPIAEWHGDTRDVVGVQFWLNSKPWENGAIFGALVDTNLAPHNLVSPQGILQPNVFQHVALTYDKATGIGTLYLNGAVVAQANLGTFTPLTSDDLWIAHRPFDVPGDWTYGATLGGSLDEFSIYNRALTSDEIAGIYTAGSAGKCSGASGVAPAITQQPTNQTVAVGGTATFSATATGTAPLHYQWYGPASALIPGATSSTLTLSNVQQGAAGSYFLFVTNSYGFAESSNAVLTVTGGGGNTNASCTPPPTGLVAWWKAENNANDSIGNNNGVFLNNPSYASGEVNQAFNFDGASYVQVPDAPALHFTNTMSVEAWINLSALNGYYNEILSKFGAAELNQNSYTFTVEPGGHLRFNVAGTNYPANVEVLSSATVPLNQWVHVAGVADGTSVKVYVNGQLAGSVPWNGGLFSGNMPVTIGCTMQASPLSFFNGKIDEVSLYNRALASNEIAAIYNAGSAGKCSGSNTNSGVAPMITHQPTNQTVTAGGTASFSVTATGTSPLHYQWYGPAAALIPGATTSTLTLSNVQPGAAGSYYAFVTNTYGFAQSSNAVLTVTSGGNTNANCMPPPSGLVSWWKGELNTLDSAGTNNGFAVNGSLAYAAGKVGSAFHSAPTNGYVQVPASPSLNVGQGAGFTLEGWIQPADLVNQLPIFEWEFNTNNGFGGAHFWTSTGGAGCLYANIADSANTSHILSSAPGILTTNYQHVALTYDKSSGVASIYRNGTLVAQSNLGSFTPNTTGNLLLGERTYFGPQNHYVGNLDELSIYSRALSSNEIAAIYSAGSAGKCGGSNTNSSLAPLITKQPTNQTVAVGGTATFSVTATGSPAVPLRFQWYGPAAALIQGATSSTLTLSNVQPGAAGSYFVLVTNLYGSAQSSNAVLTVTSGGNTNSNCTPPPSGLVGWWKGELNTLDSAGTNNGVASNGSLAYAVGKVGNAFHFEATNGYVEVPASPSLNVGQGAGFTLEGWIQPADMVNERPIFEWQFNTNNGFGGAHFWTSTGGAGCLYANIADTNNNSHTISSAPGILTSAFQHVALTYDKSSGIASIYRNGTLVAQSNLGSFTPNTTGNLLLGERTYLGGAPQVQYTGNLDELSLYSRALGSNEIAAIYNAGSAGTCSGSNTNSGVAPMITHQPTNQTVAAGGTATFSATATGTAPLYYQWYGPASALIPGANNPTLTLSNVQAGAAGSYYLWVTNLYGFAQSSNAVLTVTSGGGNTNSNCTPPPSGLVSWWPGEGNGNDVAGSNNAIAESGLTYAPGKVGQAFQLVDYTNFLHVPASPSLDVGAGNGMTMEGWIKVSSVDGMHPIAEWYSDTRGIAGPQLWIDPTPYNSGALFGVLVDTNANVYRLTSADGVLQPNVFQHVALTYDKTSGIGTLYLNGAIVAQDNLGSFVPQTTYNLWIGHRPFDVPGDWTYGATLGGLLDELSLYNRALSSNEVSAIYNAGSAGKCSGSNTNSGLAPTITKQPTNQTVTIGGTATFSVIATGSPAVALHFQWYGPSNNFIPGAIHSTLILSNVQPAAAGAYFVTVSNSLGFVTSSNAILTVTSGGNTNSNCTPPPSGLVSWWRAEGNANDSADGNNGTLVNGAGFTSGEIGQGFLFTQTNQNVLIPASSNLDVGQGNGFTLETWIKPNDLTHYDPIFEWNPGDAVTYWGVHLYVVPTGATNGYLYANVQGVGDVWHQMQTASGVVIPNTFQHVALTYDKSSGVARLYRNGAIVAEAAFGSFTPKTTGNLNIGSRPIDPAGEKFGFTGVIDEPSVYNRALGSNEIAAIYSAGSAGKCTSPLAPHSLISQQPAVNLTVSDGTQVLTWPASAGGYVLQSADSLTPPIKWTNVPATLQTNGDTIQTILPTAGAQGYFRLYQP